MRNIKIVVARYNENLDWLNKLNYPNIIYNKNKQDNLLFEHNLINIGKDAHTYLTYILNNYYNLPEYVVFLQGHPFDHHCNNLIEWLNDYKFDTQFYPIGATYVRDIDSLVEAAVKYAKEYNIAYELPLKFIAGMQCVVAKELIQRNPKEMYLALLESILTDKESTGPGQSDNNSYNIWNLEYLWPTIFGVNTTMPIKSCL